MWKEDRRQKSEDRRQKSEDRRQKSGVNFIDQHQIVNYNSLLNFVTQSATEFARSSTEGKMSELRQRRTGRIYRIEGLAGLKKHIFNYNTQVDRMNIINRLPSVDE